MQAENTRPPPTWPPSAGRRSRRNTLPRSTSWARPAPSDGSSNRRPKTCERRPLSVSPPPMCCATSLRPAIVPRPPGTSPERLPQSTHLLVAEAPHALYHVVAHARRSRGTRRPTPFPPRLRLLCPRCRPKSQRRHPRVALPSTLAPKSAAVLAAPLLPAPSGRDPNEGCRATPRTTTFRPGNTSASKPKRSGIHSKPGRSGAGGYPHYWMTIAPRQRVG
jgi:hypothetical protein